MLFKFKCLFTIYSTSISIVKKNGKNSPPKAHDYTTRLENVESTLFQNVRVLSVQEVVRGGQIEPLDVVRGGVHVSARGKIKVFRGGQIEPLDISGKQHILYNV